MTPVGVNRSRDERVHLAGVQPAKLGEVRVREVADHEVKDLVGVPQPGHCVIIDDLHTVVGEAPLVQGAQTRVGPCEGRHRRVVVAYDDPLDGLETQEPGRRQPVAPTADEDSLRLAEHGGSQREALVVAILVGLVELDHLVEVERQPKPRLQRQCHTLQLACFVVIPHAAPHHSTGKSRSHAPNAATVV